MTENGQDKDLKQLVNNDYVDGIRVANIIQKKRKNNSSGYKGVSYCKVSKTWRAYLRIKGVLYEKRGFSSAESAYYNGRLKLEEEHYSAELVAKIQERQLEYKGEKHTLFEWAEKEKVSVQTYKQRYKSGVRGDDLKKPRKRGKKILIGEQEYTISEATKKWGVSEDTIRYRMEIGLTGLDLVQPPMKRNDLKLLIEGQEYTVAEASAKWGILVSTINSRVRRGLTGLDLVQPPIKKRSGLKILIEGQKYTISEASKKWGVPAITIRSRFKRGLTGLDLVRKK